MDRKPLGVYIHIPFCVRKCLYCDFASAPGTPEEIAAYLRLLQKEIRSFAPIGGLYELRSVFFGGGTPSIVRPDQLQTLLELLRSYFAFAPDAELTLECNPGTLTREKLLAYRAMGINRLSIGLQSVHQDELRLLGRIHSFEEFRDNYRLARDLGFSNINVDLMSALPRQSLAKWQTSLETVAALSPEHISAYSLIVEEGTPFYEQYGTRQGRLYLPGEELEREMVRLTKSLLADHGYHRYEISNYAREGFESRHNTLYWTEQEYLGFGLSAASFLDGRRFSQPAEREAYAQTAVNAYRSFRQTAPLTQNERMEEFMFLGLRMTRGVSRRRFQALYGRPFPAPWEGVIDRYREGGFLETDADTVRLTDRGMDVSNIILSDFLLD